MAAQELGSAAASAPYSKDSKGYRGAAMEGGVARWYARVRGTPEQLATIRAEVRRFANRLADGARVLEVAPGPGYFAIELAQVGRFRVTGLDISHTFVSMARDRAQSSGVSVVFEQGDASRMPFADESFDQVICQAAFKNFSRPVGALNEMYRVLVPGGSALIQDMNHDVSSAAIRDEVRRMGLGRWNAFFTARALHGLRRRAYTVAQFDQLVRTSEFRTGEIHLDGIGLDVQMAKSASGTPTVNP